MGLALPGEDGAVVDLGLVKLGRCSGKDGTGLALVVAMAVTVVEGDVTYAGPAVLDYGGGMELGHGVYGVRVSTKIAKKPLLGFIAGDIDSVGEERYSDCCDIVATIGETTDKFTWII